MHRLRGTASALLSRAPALRRAFHLVRNTVQRADSGARRHLPARLGGRYPDAAVACRRIEANELDALHALREGSDPLSRETLARASDLSSATEFCVGIYVEGVLAGCGWCVSVGEPGVRPFRDTLLVSDFVQPRHRRRGLAQRLHVARLAMLEARYAERVYAWVDGWNAPSLAGFAATGFREVPRASHPSWLEAPSPRHVLLARDI